MGPLLALSAVLTATGLPAHGGTLVFNGDFELGRLDGWASGGTGGGSAAVVTEATCFSANDTTGLRLGGVHAARLRSGADGDPASAGVLTSEPFTAGSGVSFLALTETVGTLGRTKERPPVSLTVRVLSPAGVVLAEHAVRTALVPLAPGCPSSFRDAAFSRHFVNTRPFADQPIRIQFRQHTNRSGYGFGTLIDDVTRFATEETPHTAGLPVPIAGLSTGRLGAQLDAGASYDPDTNGNIVSYHWRIDGEPVERVGETVPIGDLRGNRNYRVTLEIDDGFARASDTLIVAVPDTEGTGELVPLGPSIDAEADASEENTDAPADTEAPESTEALEDDEAPEDPEAEMVLDPTDPAFAQLLPGGDFESGLSLGEGPGAELVMEGSCFSAGDTRGIELPGTWSMALRSDNPDFPATLRSPAFDAGDGVVFQALSEALPHAGKRPFRQTRFEIGIIASDGSTLARHRLYPSVVTLTRPCPGEARDGGFSTHFVSTRPYRGQVIAIEFSQSSEVANEAPFTLIDNVVRFGDGTEPVFRGRPVAAAGTRYDGDGRMRLDAGLSFDPDDSAGGLSYKWHIDTSSEDVTGRTVLVQEQGLTAGDHEAILFVTDGRHVTTDRLRFTVDEANAGTDTATDDTGDAGGEVSEESTGTN